MDPDIVKRLQDENIPPFKSKMIHRLKGKKYTEPTYLVKQVAGSNRVLLEIVFISNLTNGL